MTSLITFPVGASALRTTPGTTTDGQNAEFTLGTRATGPDGAEYVYVQAAAALLTATTDPNAVGISTTFQASLMTTALAGTSKYELGFAPPVAIADNDFFWARITGSNFNARVAASAAATTYLRTTITAGRLGTASTASAVVFEGVVITVAASASTSAGNSVRNVLMTKGRAIRSGASTFVN
jgi:hypothetical protein